MQKSIDVPKWLLQLYVLLQKLVRKLESPTES